MPKNKETLSIIVNGTSYEIEVNLNAPLKTVIEKALQQSNNTGQPKENWELKDESGNLLDLDKKICDFGFANSIKLFLNIKAGVGGKIGTPR